MQISRRLARNIFSSWMSLFVQMGVLLVLTPLVLEALGGVRYGVWALLSTITGYYGLLDIGARASVMRNVAHYHALGDFERMNRVASAAQATLLGCGGLLLVATLLCAAFGGTLFRLPEELADEFRWCVLAVGTSEALKFCFYVHSSAVGARQRQDLTAGIQIITHVVYACGVPLILSGGGRLVALSVWLGGTNLVACLAMWQVAKRVCPELAPSWRNVDRAAFKEFADFGLWQFLVNLSQQVIGYSDALVISLAMTASAIAPFYLANRIARCFARFFIPVCVVFFPVLTHFEAVGSDERIRRMYLRGSRLMWLLSIGLCFIAISWRSEFFHLWIGDRQEGFEGRVSDLFVILLVAAAFTAPQQVGKSMLLARGGQRLLAALFTAEAATNLVLSLALVGTFGLWGIAWGTCLPAILFQGWLHPRAACRMLNLEAGTYWKETLWRPAAFGLLLASVGAVRPDVAVHSWLALVMAGVCSSVVVAVLAVTVGLDRADRERFVYSPLRRIVVVASKRFASP